MNIGAGYTGPGDYATPVIEEIPSYTLDVEIEVEGTGNPDDLYIDISPRLATYPEGTEVTITAVNFAACCHDFVQWEGKGKMANGQNINGCKANATTVVMTENMDIKAVYKGDCEEETDGIEVLYDTGFWRDEGYQGDQFWMKVPDSPPSKIGGEWEGLVMRERLCVLGMSKNLMGYWGAEESAEWKATENGDGTSPPLFGAVKEHEGEDDDDGTYDFPEDGYWLIAPDESANLGGLNVPNDCHYFDAGRKTGLVEFFDDNPAAEVMLKCKQTFYVIDRPELSGKDKDIGTALLEFKLNKVNGHGNCYNINSSDLGLAHCRVRKSGAAHPCAWDSDAVLNGPPAGSPRTLSCEVRPCDECYNFCEQ